MPESLIARLRQRLPSTSVPLARASSGLLVALACLVGWVALRWAAGVAPRDELAAHRGLYAYMLVVTAAVVTWFGYALGRVEEKLRRANHELVALATTDELTGLRNARVFHSELPRLVSLARRARIALSLVMIDLDHFKRINDTHGHPAGDALLRAAGAALARGRRREDVVARVGGEEFALALPGVDLAGAQAVAERVIAAIRAIEVAEFPGVRASASAGVAALSASEPVEQLVARADRALYAAKEAGRDRVALAPSLPPPAPGGGGPRSSGPLQVLGAHQT